MKVMIKNNNVICNVTECKFNDKNKNCTLEQIKVTKHEAIAKDIDSTNCSSFQSMK